MLKFSRKSHVDITTYQHRINRNGAILIDRELMQNMLDYKKVQRDTLMTLARNVMYIDSSNNCIDLSSQCVYTFLTSFMKCPEGYFFLDGREKHSLDTREVLSRLVDDGYAEEFLEYYMGYTSTKSRCARMEKTMMALYGTDLKTRDGRPLSSLSYTASEQQNLRFNYQDSDIISLPKDYSHCQTVEEGYFLAWGDFAQADLRAMLNLFIRDDKSALILDNTKDKYEAVARLMFQSLGSTEQDSSGTGVSINDGVDLDSEESRKWIRLGLPEQLNFDIEKFKEERELYKTEVLATTYGSHGGNNKKTQAFADRFRKFLESCPRYAEYKKRLSDAFDLGLVATITGYFGYEQPALAGKHKGAKQNFINKGLNTPIQTATSQIIILTVNEILNRCYAMGYTEDDISIYVVRHDEPIFKISERMLNDIWVLKQAQEIIIDNWTPMEINFKYGYNYKVEDAELTEKVNQVVERNIDKIDIFTPDATAEEYWPIKKQLVLSVSGQAVGDKTVLSVYKDADNENETYTIDHILLPTSDIEEVGKQMVAHLTKAADYADKNGYGGVLVNNQYIDLEAYFEGIFFKYKMAANTSTDIAWNSSHIIAAKYAEREGIPFARRNDIIEANLDFIKKAGALRVFN